VIYNFHVTDATDSRPTHDKKQKYASNEKTLAWGRPMGVEDLGVLWVWGFCGNSHRFSVAMGWV